MTDPRELLARYLEQRREMGESPLFLEAAITGDQERSRAKADEAPSIARDRGSSPPIARDRPRSPPVARRETQRGDWRRGAPPIPPTGIVIPSAETDLFSADPLGSMGLDEIAATVRQCTKCGLCRARANAVPGEGRADARLVVVGEGPGATEDETGRPFVGRAGQLLTEILAAIELPREQVFICNVVKCRPPENRKPQQDEIDACVPFLYRQLSLIRPKVIMAMGNTAAETLLKTRQSLGSLRGRVHQFRGVPLIVTYHPAALLRNPHWKKPTWDDVRIARQLVDA